MTVLNSLSDNQKKIITRLPYRVGLWVSESDTTGGDEAAQKEQQALHNIIEGFSGQVFGSELLQHIMAATLEGKDDWPNWRGALDGVPDECAQAVDILRSYADEKEANAYAVRLMEIGEAVALAFREYGHVDSPMKTAQAYMTYFFITVSARLKAGPTRSFDEFIQVSPPERKALNKLAQSLGTSYL